MKPDDCNLEKPKQIRKKKECSICYKLFDSGGYFNRHLRTHSDERPYTCKVC